MRTLRHHPDVIALVVLGLFLLVPALAAPHVPRDTRAFHLTPISWGEFDVAADPGRINGLEDLAEWTTNIERRGERVWQRLSDRMRRFEERFDKLSNVPPRSRSIHCETASD